MGTLMIDNDYLAGIDLLRQYDLAAVLELRTDSDLSEPQRELLRTELAEDHRHRCTQVWAAISSQIRSDLGV